MQTTGTYISAVGHVGLIGWLLLGWGLSADPLEFEEVLFTTVSTEEFAALTSARSTPEPATAEPDAPIQPVIDPTTPPPPTDEATPAVQPPPDPVAQPVEDTPPPDPPQITPPTQVTDAAPNVPAPPPSVAPDLPVVTDEPTPRPADIVAPEATEAPSPDAQVDDVVRQEAVPDQDADPDIVEDEQVEAAPEDVTTEIVNEDQTPSGAVETSIRPSARPNRPAPADPVAETAAVDPPAQDEPDVDDAVAAALEDALASTEDTPVASEAPAVSAGPPMTGSEKDAFRVAINQCWNIDPGSEAARAKVTVVFELGRDGRVIGNPRLASGSGGSDASINIAYEAARRAILRCQGQEGYQLPAEKYEEWREVTANFDASGAQY